MSTGFACLMDQELAAQCGAHGPRDLASCLHAAQTAALRQTLQYARQHSVFYARHLAGCDTAVRGLGNLAGVPFTDAAQLIRNGGRDFLCVSQDAVQRMVSLHTSGTTGSPKRLAFTEHDLRRTVKFFSVGMAQLLRPADRLAVLLPGAERPDGVADLLRQALAGMGVTVVPLSAAAIASLASFPQTAAEELAALRPQCLVAAPAQLAALLQFFSPDALSLPEQVERVGQTGYAGQAGQVGQVGQTGQASMSLKTAALAELRGILCSADYLDPALCRTVRAAWGCELLDHYGLTETAYGCAVECPAHDGRHLREMDLLLEIIDPLTTAPVPDGMPGEIVLTTLNREAMPLIRYRTGDAARLLPGPCACGSPLRRLGSVEGRIVWCNGRPASARLPKGGTHAAQQREAAW